MYAWKSTGRLIGARSRSPYQADTKVNLAFIE